MKRPTISFTESDVARIKRLLLAGFSPREIAQARGCSTETIRRMGRGETWGHVEPEPLGGKSEPLPIPDEIKASQERLQKLLAEAQEVKEVDAELERMKRKTPYY